MKEGAPLHEVPPLDPYVVQRARRLDHVLDRIDLTEQVLQRQAETGRDLKLRFVQADARGIDKPTKGEVIFDATLIRGMKTLAQTLYNDLLDAGEPELAQDIVEQHFLERRQDMVDTQPLRARPDERETTT